MRHGELQKRITELCRDMRLHVHACDVYRSGSQAGFPDLVIISARAVLWRELKVPPDELKPAQIRMKYALLASRQNWAIWTPADWESGQIQDELESVL